MTTSEGVRLSSLLQIAMRVEDLDRAVAFYRDVLGAPFLFQVPNLAFFDLDGVRLMLDKPESAEFDHPGSILYFRVPEVQPAYEALRAKGVEFVDEPHIVHRDDRHELWMAFFKDTEGNHLALAAEVPVGG
jgi:catechol 2,3-dioxygenase-like lactoylglutathione lyase family enzyme